MQNRLNVVIEMTANTNMCLRAINIKPAPCRYWLYVYWLSFCLEVPIGACQGSYRLTHAAKRSIERLANSAATTESRSGLMTDDLRLVGSLVVYCSELLPILYKKNALLLAGHLEF